MKSSPSSKRQRLDDYRASFWKRVVWINQVIPGTVTLTVSELKKLTVADRLALLDAVDELAQLMSEQQDAARSKHRGD